MYFATIAWYGNDAKWAGRFMENRVSPWFLRGRMIPFQPRVCRDKAGRHTEKDGRIPYILFMQNNADLLSSHEQGRIMTQAEFPDPGFKGAGEDLFNFAVDREDVKIIAAHLSGEAKCKPAAVEYELQLLKIISTGWSISFFMGNHHHRKQLEAEFWELIHEFSANLSETTGLMTGHDIDYFQIIKSRLDMYVEALAHKPGTNEPAAIIGPEFARVCGDEDDVFTVMAGSRMFILTVARVKEFIESLELG
jgi:hypothetical protein